MVKTKAARRLSAWKKCASTLALALAIASNTPAFAEDTLKDSSAKSIAITSATDPWGIATNDLKPDPTIRQGVLANGMKYALQKNETPKGGASIRFNLDVGMADEEENEVGLAHLLEHMAFNGSTNIPEGELIKKLERLGLAFGADTNAETSVDRTTYKLDLPKADAETVDAALLMMREIASELTIAPEAVDRERGILESERQVRDVAQRRRAADWLTSALPGTRLGTHCWGWRRSHQNDPGGTGQSLLSGYYRPERATLAIVGDFDLDAMEKQIRDRFSNWKGNGLARSKYAIAFQNADTPIVRNFSDPSMPEIVELHRVDPYQTSTNTEAEERQSILEAIATIALNKRFDKLTRDTENGLLLGQALQQEPYRAATSFGIITLAKDGEWQKALGLAEKEARRAREFGFSQSEIKEAIAALDNVFRNGAQQASSRASAELADGLVTSALSKTVVQSPAEQLALFERNLPSVSAESVKAAFVQAWGNGPTSIHITTKTPVADVMALAQSTLADSAKIAVTAPEELAKAVFAYDSFGKAGKIASDKMIADLSIRTIQFANGVRLNIKKTDFEPGKIHFGMRVGGGTATLPKGKPGLAKFLEIMSGFDGLQKNSIDDLQQITAGRTVKLGLKAESDAFESVGATNAKDLDLQLKLLAATISSLGYRDETQAQWPEVAKLIEKNIQSNPVQTFLETLPHILSNGDDRFGISDPIALKDRSMAELKMVIDKQLKKGAVEIALVGDVNEDQAIQLVASTLGALPKRAASPKFSPGQLTRKFASNLSPRIVTYDGKEDQGMFSLHWPTTDDSDLKSSLARDLLASVMSLQLTEVVREKLGATYTPEAFSMASSDYPGFGHISVVASAAPDKMDLITAAVKDIAKDLREQGITDDQLLRARKPIAERYERQMRENAAWVGIVNVAQSQPHRLDRRRQRAAVLAALTPADIQAVARQYLTENGALDIRILAKTAPAAP
ncbi:MAG: insulinase family protein [Sphingomonadales bacterium]|nr:insulinase family protein [Sphingomonadales bacterium]